MCHNTKPLTFFHNPLKPLQHSHIKLQPVQPLKQAHIKLQPVEPHIKLQPVQHVQYPFVIVYILLLNHVLF